ncbi:MAG TPA: hypothetical protein VLU46_13895 [Thermoanaerobaculia bacterium]|nr:hypothetical protein [Thermoanaerobaculia bacterium]
MKSTAIVFYAASAIFLVALLGVFGERRGPFFAKPATVYDHVSRDRHPTVNDILLFREAEPMIPHGATVMVIKPSEKPNDDTTHIDTAAGLLPYQRLVAPSERTRADYVIAIRDPFGDPHYRVVAEFPEGKLYARR